jgi:hypothetical protein
MSSVLSERQRTAAARRRARVAEASLADLAERVRAFISAPKSGGRLVEERAMYDALVADRERLLRAAFKLLAKRKRAA